MTTLTQHTDPDPTAEPDAGAHAGKRRIPSFAYKLMLLAAALIWGLSFVVMKDAVDVLEPATLIGVRFFVCGLILAVVFQKRLRAHLDRRYVLGGLACGALIFIAYWLQTIGLANTTPGKNAFITATYVVIVPFAWWLAARRRPTAANVVAAVLCVVGIGLVSVTGNLTVGFGDLMTLVSAVFFAAHIVYVAIASKDRDVFVLTVYQFLFGGVLGLLIGGLTEPAPDLSLVTPAFLFNMAYLVLFASLLALLFQNVAIAKVPPAQGALLLSLESVFGVLSSVLLYGEAMTLRLVVGFALIFVAIVVSETFPLKEAPWHRKSNAPKQASSTEATSSS